MPSNPLCPQERLCSRDVSAFKLNHLKMQIGKSMELRVPVWHSSMCKAFLIRMRSALEVIERKGYFKAYVEANKVYTE